MTVVVFLIITYRRPHSLTFVMFLKALPTELPKGVPTDSALIYGHRFLLKQKMVFG